MPVKYALNTHDGEIIRYAEAEGITDFPRGTLLAYRDFIVTGFDSQAEARAARAKYLPCRNCNDAIFVQPGQSKCSRCGSELQPAAEEGR